MRDIKINIDPLDLAEMQDTTRGELTDAVGYLSTWGFGRYADVTISREGDVDLVAVYRDAPDGDVRYVIGAVWHHDHYGFHS